MAKHFRPHVSGGASIEEGNPLDACFYLPWLQEAFVSSLSGKSVFQRFFGTTDG